MYIKGQGTKIERLMERFSIIIPLVQHTPIVHSKGQGLTDIYFKIMIQLRRQIQQMKIRSGLKMVYQNNPHPISPQSLRTFLKMAQVHMCDTSISDNSHIQDDQSEVENILVHGIDKFKAIIRAETQKGQTSRFTWGSMKERNINLND